MDALITDNQFFFYVGGAIFWSVVGIWLYRKCCVSDNKNSEEIDAALQQLGDNHTAIETKLQKDEG